MFLLASVAPFVVLASTVVAKPIGVRDSLLSFCLHKHIDSNTIGPKQYSGTVKRKRDNSGTSPASLVSYYANVGIGNPAKNCGSSQPRSSSVSYIPFTDSLVVSTGYANTWVENSNYDKTGSSMDTHNTMVSIVFCLAGSCSALCKPTPLLLDRAVCQRPGESIW